MPARRAAPPRSWLSAPASVKGTPSHLVTPSPQDRTGNATASVYTPRERPSPSGQPGGLGAPPWSPSRCGHDGRGLATADMSGNLWREGPKGRPGPTCVADLCHPLHGAGRGRVPQCPLCRGGGHVFPTYTRLQRGKAGSEPRSGLCSGPRAGHWGGAVFREEKTWGRPAGPCPGWPQDGACSLQRGGEGLGS